MSIADAPIYVRANDLAVWICQATAAWASPAGDLADIGRMIGGWRKRVGRRRQAVAPA